MEESSSSVQLSYDDRFYPTRRASLSYSTLLFLFSCAIPQIDKANGNDYTTKVTLTIADVSFDTRVLTALLMAAVIFYTFGFWRAHSTTALLNSDAIAKSANELSEALKRIASEVEQSARNFGLANRLYHELFSRLNDPSVKPLTLDLIIPDFQNRIKSLNMEALQLSTIRSVSKASDVTDREKALQQSALQILNEFQQSGDRNLKRLSEKQSLLHHDTTLEFERMASKGKEALDQIHTLNANFNRLSRNYYGIQARWYYLYDIAPVYSLSAIALVLGMFSLFNIHYRDFSSFGIILAILIVAALCVPVVYKWWPDLHSNKYP